MSLVPLSSDLSMMERVEPSGFSLASYVLRLPSGGTLLHAPIWLGDAAADEVANLGTPEILFAPNHYHHLSLAKWRARFPKARIVASEGARPRLSKQKKIVAAGLTIEPLESVASELPRDVRFLVCPGTKTGETFLSIPFRAREPGQTGEGAGVSARALLVCDAFFHVTRPTTGLMGFILRATDTAPGLTIGKTFMWLALKDRAAYGTWLRRVLAEEAPTKLFFSHGAPYDVGTREELDRLVSRKLFA